MNHLKTNTKGALTILKIILIMAALSLAIMGCISAIDVNPKVAQYDLPLRTGQISNYQQFTNQIPLSNEAVNFLRANGFVMVADPFYPEEEYITDPYERLKEKEIPLFITTDSLLHLYHIQFDETLREIEERAFYDDLWNLSQFMLSKAEEDYNRTTGIAKEAARMNMAFFAVGLSLLQPEEDQLCQGRDWECPDWHFEGGYPYFTRDELENYTIQVPSTVSGLVSEELDLIEDHNGFVSSPLFGYEEDYSQYQPRGHYTRSERLKNYFRAMMWYGRMGFLIKGCDSCMIPEKDAQKQTLAASMIAQNLRDDSTAMASWDRIYNVTSFYVGYSDDLGPYEYNQALYGLFGTETAKDLTKEDLANLKMELAQLGSPKIYGGAGQCLAETVDQADQCLADTAGLRLMGQRFIPDSYLLQNLVYPKAGDYIGNREAFTLGTFGRHFPRGLDVMLFLGSNRSEEILAETNDSSYRNYHKQMEMLKEELASLVERSPQKNLYWSWLYALQPLLNDFGQGYPTFMQTSAWQDKELTTALASWAELRHDTILYAKQSYGETAAAPGPVEKPKPVVGYVEPVPEFYKRLSDLTLLTRKGLEEENLLDRKAERRMEDLEVILKRLKDISLAELMDRELNEDDYQFIKNFKSEINWVISDVDETSKRTTIVADVHTDPNTGQVLEECVGYVRLIAVVYQVPDGRILVGAGPVFSYYEFKQPVSDRLTDEAWRMMLKENPPDDPEWVCNYAGWCKYPLSLPEDRASSGLVSSMERVRALLGI